MLDKLASREKIFLTRNDSENHDLGSLRAANLRGINTLSANDRDKTEGSGSARKTNGLARRDFLKIVGAGAGATAVSCEAAPRTLYPYVDPQRNALVGEAAFYTSVCRECPAGCGLHVRVKEGRAVKLEGNPEHPVNLGALCARGQAGLLRTYTHERFRRPQDQEGNPVSWTVALRRVGEALRAASGAGQGRVVLWSGLETGTLMGLYAGLARAVGGQHLMYEPHQVEPSLEAYRAAFSRYDLPRYELGDSDLVVALEADLFETYHSPVELARQVIGDDHTGEHRAGLVWVGPRRGVTGMLADHWVPIRPGASGLFALALLLEIITQGGRFASAARRYPQIDGLLRTFGGGSWEELVGRAGVETSDIREVARRIAEAERPVVLPPGPLGSGPHGAAANAAAVILNEVFGAHGQSLQFDAPSAMAMIAPTTEVLSTLNRMRSGEVDLLIIAGQNPLFDLPGGVDVRGAIERVPMKVAIADRPDATTQLSDLILASSTPLESWGDFSPRGDVMGLMQPVMEPLFRTKMTGDILIGLASTAGVLTQVSPEARTFEEAVRERWASSWGLSGLAAEARFRQTQRRGFEVIDVSSFIDEVDGLEAPEEVEAEPEAEVGAEAEAEIGAEAEAETETEAEAEAETEAIDSNAGALVLRGAVFDLVTRGLRQDPELPEDSVLLASYAPIGSGLMEQATGAWLDELPEPTTATVWGSPAEMHPDTAARFGLSSGDTVKVESDGEPIRLPLVIHEAVRPDVVAVPIGGRTERPEGQWPVAPATEPERLRGDYRASSVALLLSANSLQDGVGVIRSGQPVRVSRSSRPVTGYVETRHFDQHGRAIARAQGVEGLGHGHHDLPIMGSPEEAGDSEERQLVDMYGLRDYPDHRWAMAIDLDRCTGCSACIVACHAENNVSVVGPEHVEYGREMHWLQIHTYWERDHAGRPIPLYLPMLCQHCHQAPCESVCPVYAPYQTPEGLNGQVYNRCVGTRFCSNNCPYKVRRFNWFDWPRPRPLNLQLNPDVTVRTAGVMEKCTFCVQRIREAKEEAKLADRELRDGDVVPACAQTCPTGALVFGDFLDEESRVRQLVESQHSRGYHVLGHVGTRPAITYLERVVRWRNS